MKRPWAGGKCLGSLLEIMMHHGWFCFRTLDETVCHLTNHQLSLSLVSSSTMRGLIRVKVRVLTMTLQAPGLAFATCACSHGSLGPAVLAALFPSIPAKLLPRGLCTDSSRSRRALSPAGCMVYSLPSSWWFVKITFSVRPALVTQWTVVYLSSRLPSFPPCISHIYSTNLCYVQSVAP